MKIESSNNTNAVTQTGATRAINSIDAASAVGAVQKTSASSSTVSLSSVSALRAANVPDIDTAKVDSIKAALRNGTYKIDTNKIADGMMRSVGDLLQTKAV
jgi:negative regulator of flagellin synthesis FlgM